MSLIKIYQKIVNFYINFYRQYFCLITDDIRFIIHNNEILIAAELSNDVISSTEYMYYFLFPMDLVTNEIKTKI